MAVPNVTYIKVAWVVNRGIDNKKICFLTCWQEQEAITKENVIVVYFQPRGRKDLRLKREIWKVLWGPCLLWIGLALSVLILQHVLESLVPLSSINWPKMYRSFHRFEMVNIILIFPLFLSFSNDCEHYGGAFEVKWFLVATCVLLTADRRSLPLPVNVERPPLAMENPKNVFLGPVPTKTLSL